MNIKKNASDTLGERYIEFKDSERLVLKQSSENKALKTQSSEQSLGCKEQQLRWQAYPISALPNPKRGFCHPTNQQSYCPAVLSVE
jgi:hypothetical protein